MFRSVYHLLCAIVTASVPNLGIMMAPNRFTRVYRSCLFQIVIVGLVSFCEPGIWTALNNLGAGGQASVSQYVLDV